MTKKTGCPVCGFDGPCAGCYERDQLMAELTNELMEQARCNGMGGEREAALLGKLERLERENAVIREDLATTYKTITELRGQVAESLATIKTLQAYVLLLEEALLKKAEGEEISHDESR